MDLLLVVLWAQPGDVPDFQINDHGELLSGLLALAGTAIYSALREYGTGRYVSLEFSQKNVGNVFDTILHIVEGVRHNDTTHYALLRRQLVSLSSALRSS